MKTLFVTLVALLFAFFLGCQSSITDPELLEPTKFVGNAEQENSAYKDAVSTWPGIIKLEGSLYDPSHRLNSMAEISGIVRYNFEKVNLYKASPKPAIKVNMYINAELKGGCPGHGPWIVFGTSEAIVNTSVNYQQVIFVEKSFKVRNTCCSPMNLVLKFQVSEKALTLVSMRLVKVKISDLPIPDPEM